MNKRNVSMKVFRFLIAISLVLMSLPAMNVSAGTQASYYVSPTGSDSNPGTLSQPFLTIQKARDVVKTINSSMTGDIYVYLRGGTYTLTSTLTFGSSDSGTNGFHVIYQNYTGETPVISGGKTITGWTLYDAGKNIYKSSAVAGGIETRQLYVNDVRAARARSTGGIPGAVQTSTGFTTTDTTMQNWGNKGDIEVVWNQLWTQSRCSVSGVAGTAITMDDPCWTTMQTKAGMNLTANPTLPIYYENAYELLAAAGQFYLDRTTQIFYYIPRTGENMATASVIAPTLETLVSGTGTIASKIKNINFVGLTFSYATWLEPNSTLGYAHLQAGCYVNPIGQDGTTNMPANVSFIYADGINFTSNIFTKLGAAGLGFDKGAQNNSITGNEFTDISGAAIQLGGIQIADHHPSDSRDIVKNNNITKNYVHAIGSEYLGSVGIWVGYTEATYIAQNELKDLPYTAISIGWGWGEPDWYEHPLVSWKPYMDSYINNNTPTTSKNNKIINNLIYNILTTLNDGGGIYTLGAQPGELIQGNYIYQDHNDFGAIYLDDGSRYITVRNNVMESNVRNLIVKGSDHDIQYNYMDVTSNNYYLQKKTVLANNYANSGSEYTSIKANAGRFGTISYEETTVYNTNIDLNTHNNVAYLSTATALWLDGSLATMHTGHEAAKAVNGIAQGYNYAQANGQYPWMLYMYLGGIKDIDSVTTTFAPGGYATEYAILISTDNITWTEVKHVYGNSALEVKDDLASTISAQFVVVKGIKPDGPGQPGGQMCIEQVAVHQANDAIKLTAKTDGTTGNKYYYQSISTAPFTFQSGDQIVYSVYLTSNTNQTGGIEVLTTDNTAMRNFNVVDQNGIDARPFGDITANAYQMWYMRIITIPAGMVGKTVSKWMLVSENDQNNQLIGALYDNFYVLRGTNNVLTVYNSNGPQDNTTIYSSGMAAVTPATVVNGR